MSTLLDTIDSPADLKRLSRNDLPQLATEMRQRILDVVATNGGHLASNLGATELAIALHYLFESPRDQIIWDVSHQAYPHKLLTGRRQQFPTIRQYQGISGFCRREESPHDIFNAGHAGTSISAALGLATARDLRGDDHHVVVVIGDGALTAGMAWEALNNAGAQKRDLLVILNDNEMSISPNVGAISQHLNKIITGQVYNTLRKDIERMLRQIPGVGRQVARAAGRLEDAVKGLIVPGRIFEDLGFRYLGPLDGHNLPALLDTLSNIKQLHGPILLHVVTKKGMGYKLAEADAVTFHGPSPFDVVTGAFKPSSGPPKYTTVFAQALITLAQADERIVAITAAMASGTGLDRFAKALPARAFDVGIAEQHAVTFAAGLATHGLRPVCAIYSTFLQRAYDQVIHDVCLMRLPVTFALDRAGLVGEDGPTHHGIFDLAYLRPLPGMVIMAPKDENELRHMLKTALDYDGPAAVRYPRGAGEGVRLDATMQALPLGQGEVVREGDDLVVVALGAMVMPALRAAEAVQAEGIEAAVINPRFVKPLDVELLEQYARRTGAVLTVEDHVRQGGFGSAVVEALADQGVTGVTVLRHALPDVIIAHGAQELLRQDFGLNEAGIAARIRQLYARRQRQEMATLLSQNGHASVGWGK
jgi:1-deoxy-D-xylulose-5-phosphate synthase